MYSIILSSENVILGCTDNLQYLEDGLVAVSDHVRFARSAYEKIVQVESIPEDYADGKYQYTVEDGFKLNVRWVEPNSAVDPKILVEKVQQLESDLGNALIESAVDKAKITELEKAQGDLLMELATLKMGGSA